MERLRRQRRFLTDILKEANRKKRQRMLQYADKDQINAISEMVFNLLKKRIPIDATTYGKLKRHKKVLREVGRRKNSLKHRRVSLESKRCGVLERITRLFQSMLCTVKGRSEDGYPLEGIDVVPNFPTREDETIPKLVQLLQDANRREARWKDSSEYWGRKYHAQIGRAHV